MTVGIAILQKSDYKQRQANLELRDIQLGDLVQRKLDQIKSIQQDTKRVTDAEKAWDNAIKADAQKNANNGYVENRQKVLNSSDWKFATSVGVQDDDDHRYVLQQLYAGSQYYFNDAFTEQDNFFLTQLQAEANELEIEKDSVETQLKQVEAAVKGADNLLQNAAQDNPYWALGGGG